MLAQHRPALPPPTYKHAADPPSPYKTLIATPPDDPTPSIQVRQGDSPLQANLAPRPARLEPRTRPARVLGSSYATSSRREGTWRWSAVKRPDGARAIPPKGGSD